MIARHMSCVRNIEHLTADTGVTRTLKKACGGMPVHLFNSSNCAGYYFVAPGPFNRLREPAGLELALHHT